MFTAFSRHLAPIHTARHQPLHTRVVDVRPSEGVDKLLPVSLHLGAELSDGWGLHQPHLLPESERLGHGLGRVELYEVRHQLSANQLHVGSLVGAGLVVVGRREYRHHL